MDLYSPRFTTYYFQMLVFDEDKQTNKISLKYYLMAVEFVSLEGNESQTAFELNMPKPFLNVLSVFELDIDCLFKQKQLIESEPNLGSKRKMLESVRSISTKRPKTSGFFMPNLAYLISFCEEKLAYGALSCEV